MHARTARAVVMVTSAPEADRLGTAVDVLTHGWPPDVVIKIAADGSSSGPVIDLVAHVSSAAYVVVQETSRPLTTIQIATVAAARASNVPLLLISPAGTSITPLMRLADIQPSQVVFYPVSREAETEWKNFTNELYEKKEQIDIMLTLVDRTEQLAPITSRLSNNAQILSEAAPTEAVAVTIARIFDLHTSSIRLENHVDFLQLDFPAHLYADLLRHLTRTFRNVRTIADPTNEELPWDNPVSEQALAAVNERVYALDTEYALQYGTETAVAQLHAAMQAGGVVSVIGLSDTLRDELLHASPVNQSLRGINRFYAGDCIVGGYADDTANTIRLLAFHPTEHHKAVYDRELELLAEIDERKHVPPADHTKDRTTLASWLYTNVFDPKPDINAIYDNMTSQYATEYDGNIVRVTPGYYNQLDDLVTEVKRALAALYSPYSGRERQSIKMLELGIGTGNLTGRLMRMSGGFISQLWSDDNHGERSFIEFDGWDSNRQMVEISSVRLAAAAQQARDRVIRPNLQVREFDASKSEDSPPRYDLVVGSLFSHYWMDSRPNRPITKASDLREFRSFLEAVRDTLLLSDGIAMFLDVFHTDERRADEQALWRAYIERELDSKAAADTYLNRNPWQYYSAGQSLVAEVAIECGFNVWWREAAPGFPFKILTLAKAQGS
jgi:hypothetical protein